MRRVRRVQLRRVRRVPLQCAQTLTLLDPGQNLTTADPGPRTMTRHAPRMGPTSTLAIIKQEIGTEVMSAPRLGTLPKSAGLPSAPTPTHGTRKLPCCIRTNLDCREYGECNDQVPAAMLWPTSSGTVRRVLRRWVPLQRRVPLVRRVQLRRRKRKATVVHERSEQALEKARTEARIAAEAKRRPEIERWEAEAIRLAREAEWRTEAAPRQFEPDWQAELAVRKKAK